MKTPDNISKLRQKLYYEKRIWELKIDELSSKLLESNSDKPKIKKGLIFCKKNLLQCKTSLDIVKRSITVKQKLGGWQ